MRPGTNNFGKLGRSKQALEAYNDPAFIASYTIGTVDLLPACDMSRY